MRRTITVGGSIRNVIGEGCKKDGTVARLPIEALEQELDAAGGPEDARAKATLHHLIEVATGPRIELVGFPRIPDTSP